MLTSINPNTKNTMLTATRDFSTPFVLLDLQQMEHDVAALRRSLPNVEVWYAMKCNPHPQIIDTLTRLGVGFEAASTGEMGQLLDAGVSAAQIMCLHPIKSPAFLRAMHLVDVNVLAIDSQDEVDKIARFAPGSRVVARVEMSGQGCRIPLAEKFGCTQNEVVELLAYSRQRGLHPYGITMHVGSQCESPETWEVALETCHGVCKRLTEAGMPPELVSLGGGLPVPYTSDVPSIPEMGSTLSRAIERHLAVFNCRISIEPGRAIAAAAGTLVASVVGTATRAGTRWAYLDAGIYHGLFETLPTAGGLALPIETEYEDRPTLSYRLAGPTCDSLDALPGMTPLPELQTGDRVAFRYAGAYSTSLATCFNGFDAPHTVVISSESAVVESPFALVSAAIVPPAEVENTAQMLSSILAGLPVEEEYAQEILIRP